MSSCGYSQTEMTNVDPCFIINAQCSSCGHFNCGHTYPGISGKYIKKITLLSDDTYGTFLCNNNNNDTYTVTMNYVTVVSG